MKNVVIIISSFFLFFGCKKQNIVNNNVNNYTYDISGDSQNEYLQIVENNNGFTLYVDNDPIITLLPMQNESYVKTNPKIENIYIEPNNIQASKKGVRIKVRNTDLEPDYFYMDIFSANKQWIVEKYGIINTQDSIFIKEKLVNKPIAIFLGKKRICDSHSLITGLIKP
ncbi:hypothetical protein GCM10022217_01400 [Chryseobacterium ginsenosidimutans]|uniref:hypothetical protein n=1 Tax=Chryseobacterium ginsenosidimutans TaxID=687846 RepID=UPI0031E302FF